MKKMSKIHARLANKGPRAALGAVVMARAPTDITRMEEDVSNIRDKVIFMGRDEVSIYPFSADDVVISISDTQAHPPKLTYQPADLLALRFHDHVTTSEESNLGYRWMMRDDAQKIVEFVAKHTDKQNIIVHCNYGQSRSKAVAKAIQKFTARRICHADYTGRIVQYTGSDRGNERVYDLVMMAHFEHTCENA